MANCHGWLKERVERLLLADCHSELRAYEKELDFAERMEVAVIRLTGGRGAEEGLGD